MTDHHTPTSEEAVRASAVREAAAYLSRIHRPGLRSRDTILADLEAVAWRMEQGMTARGNNRPVKVRAGVVTEELKWETRTKRLEDAIHEVLHGGFVMTETPRRILASAVKQEGDTE